MEKRVEPQEGIARITVSGFKSIAEEQNIEIRPLTILAGANSSGKSSIMQPLLLLKQTLEASYDPGALLLNGPNVKFTSVEQVLSRARNKILTDTFSIGVQAGPHILTSYFQRSDGRGFNVDRTTYGGERESSDLRMGMTHDEIVSEHRFLQSMYAPFGVGMEAKWSVVQNRCFLELRLKGRDGSERRVSWGPSPSGVVEPSIRQVIHLPGLRGNPERTYPVTAVGPTFPGAFEEYTASVIAEWERAWRYDALEEPIRDLENLGLTKRIRARRIDDTRVELQVGRLDHVEEGDEDWVSVADVGFGVSQSLPVVVALHVAAPGQLVYVEQPETHLHPRAQVAMAQVLANAAQRGARIVAETHSALLLLGVQTLIAEGQLSPDLVKLHWFARREDGTTEVTSCDLDETGAFGDWPEDFGQVELAAQSRYLDAVEAYYGGGQ